MRTRTWCAVLPLACASAAQAGEAAARLADLDRRLAQIDASLAEAHFQTAAALTESTREQMDALAADGLPVAARRARLELLGATAEVALGRRAQAREHLVRALRADPALALDESRVSPKLLQLLPEARRRAARAEGAP